MSFAFQCFDDPANEDFFAQLVSYQILLDLLYNYQMYDEMYRVFEKIQEKQLNMTKFPKYPVVLILGACYKQVIDFIYLNHVYYFQEPKIFIIKKRQFRMDYKQVITKMTYTFFCQALGPGVKVLNLIHFCGANQFTGREHRSPLYDLGVHFRRVTRVTWQSAR